MQFIMDMVHDNPGEARCKTAFRNPEKLIGYAFNTQVFKHNDTLEQIGYGHKIQQ